ncbi:VOC family protein [Herbiconiux sp. CPCC 203407]|uniref:VOC family protein n=1 Tax=Herbiconiux oxytropis TaxID=2970915 RepID=A0AA41XB27_9MICO|nr:VOC family protein [Herbiconiux oxytropis]MCS5720771.1 VOC family protein [Herbiconiux oxytropis]MCS5724902.1 VOC family protein [Herbiconiux oxytropis]
MLAPVISEIGHVSIRVRDLAAAEEFATVMLGLHASRREEGQVWFTLGTAHHSIHYIRADEDALDHVGLVASDEEGLAEARRRVEAAGLQIVSDVPLGVGIEDGFAFVDEFGFVFQLYSRMTQVPAPAPTGALRPTRLGHFNFFVPDPRRMERMLTELFDFRVSDRVDGMEGGVFLRCNVDHHGIGVFPGAGRIHHVAWEYPTILEIGAIADLVDARGGSVLWGPLRHGMGRNIATYLQEPSGLVQEFYCDMERIYDDARHVPGEWSFDGHKWVSLWGPHLTPEGFSELGLPPGVRRA